MWRRPHVLFILYLIMIAAGGGAYQWLWHINRDYFRIQQGVNFRPLELIGEILQAYYSDQDIPVVETEGSSALDRLRKDMEDAKPRIGLERARRKQREDLETEMAQTCGPTPTTPECGRLVYQLNSLSKQLNWGMPIVIQRVLQDMHDYEQEPINKLGYMDFVYFSVGASTTATFGDIMPNHPLIRGLVCVQVILSLILLGRYINLMSRTSRDN